MFQLESDRLQVFIDEPGSPPNTTTRFNRAGFVSEIILDGVHRFGASEPNNLGHPGSGGRGICSEFRFDVSAQAKQGEWFPRLGVGLLQKGEEEKYNFSKKYALREFPVACRLSGQTVTFQTEAVACMGYALRHTKTLEVRGNALFQTEKVENTGEKAIDTEEYSHNFLTIDGMAIGPGYRIELPQVTDRGTGLIAGNVRGNGRGFTIDAYQPHMELIAMGSGDLEPCSSFHWTISNIDASPDKTTPVTIRGTDFFRPCRLSLWLADHMISVESFCRIAVKPGKTFTWSRKWEFDA